MGDRALCPHPPGYVRRAAPHPHLVTFSLLFGTTWYVNALVFAGILASVLLAIAVNARVRFWRARWL